MATARERLEFSIDDRGEIVDRIRELLSGGRGAWVNLEPVVDDEDVTRLQVRRGVLGLFSARGSDLPFVTVVGAGSGRRPTPGSVGIQHGAGPRAAARLEAAGIFLPRGWVRRQDHPRRGLVYEQVGEVDADATVDHLVAAVEELCPIELGPLWSAVYHEPG